MNKRGFLGVVVLLIAGIAATVILLQRRSDRQYKTDKDKLIVQTGEETIRPQDITEIHIKNPKTEFHLKRTPEGWLITEPKRYETDKEVVPLLAYRIATMSLDREIKGDVDLKTFGLDNPDVEIKYLVGKTNEWRELKFGRRSPIQGSYYVMDPGSGRLGLAQFQQKFDFNMSLDGYRDRNIFPFDLMTTSHILCRTPGKTIEYRVDPKTHNFEMLQPYRGMGDENSIGILLKKMRNQEVAGFLSEEDVKVGETGFDNPRLSCKFENDSGDSVELLVGNQVGGEYGDYYARKIGEDDVFKIFGDFYADRLSSFAEEIPRKRAIELIAGAMAEILFQKDGKSVKMVGTKRRVQWTLNTPDGPKIKMTDAVEILRKLSQYENRGYVKGATLDENAAEYGLDKPVALVKMTVRETARFPDNEVLFGKTDPTGKYVYVASTTDPYIRLVDKGIVDIIPTDPEELIQK